MTWMIAIDESGDTGHDSRYFVMAAVIARHPRVLLSASKAIPSGNREFKFYRSSEVEIKSVLKKVAESDVEVVYVHVDKHDYSSIFYGMYGNKLYRKVLSELLIKSMELIHEHDVKVYVDSSSFLTIEELKFIAHAASNKSGCNVKQCEKVVSHHNRCIQIADLVVGSIYRSYEYGTLDFIGIIEKNIHCP